MCQSPNGYGQQPQYGGGALGQMRQPQFGGGDFGQVGGNMANPQMAGGVAPELGGSDMTKPTFGPSYSGSNGIGDYGQAGGNMAGPGPQGLFGGARFGGGMGQTGGNMWGGGGGMNYGQSGGNMYGGQTGGNMWGGGPSNFGSASGITAKAQATPQATAGPTDFMSQFKQYYGQNPNLAYEYANYAPGGNGPQVYGAGQGLQQNQLAVRDYINQMSGGNEDAYKNWAQSAELSDPNQRQAFRTQYANSWRNPVTNGQYTPQGMDLMNRGGQPFGGTQTPVTTPTSPTSTTPTTPTGPTPTNPYVGQGSPLDPSAFSQGVRGYDPWSFWASQGFNPMGNQNWGGYFGQG